MLCVFSNIIGGFILLHSNCDSEVPAEGTGYTSNTIIGKKPRHATCNPKVDAALTEDFKVFMLL